MRTCLFAVFLAVVCPLLIAQQAMNNDAVVKLVKAGLSDDLIVSTVSASPGTYDTSADGLIALKAAGASDRVVGAIVRKASGEATAQQAAAPSSTAPVGTNPDDPTASHEAGIYIYDESAPAGSKMTMLEPSVYSQGKSGGFLASAMTYGIAKIKTKAVLRGAHANARVSSPKPVFYFYFEEQSAGLSHSSTGGTSTPNEFTLLKFDIKGATRETSTGSYSAFGTSGGTDDKAVTNFTYTKLRPGVYKVTINAGLEPGEYGFISTAEQSTASSPFGGGGASRIFDFGRD